ncbi:MAG TPA: 23S rRNA (guanosine(2251)-2'-O)-methyltransferase RlmB [Candidatus Manganitrophaceae bacterium]|nr:23S rRNA (guanosine(2251)-2'-O)-methyltransferase RlmB [Candidatus Manganitrophaceae bacterium]
MNPGEAVIYGVNPVLEALRAEGKNLNKIYLLPSRAGKEIDEIRTLARRQHATVLTAEREAMDRMARTAKHQGVVAFLSSQRYRDLDDLLALSRKRNEPAFFFILDEVEDPRNLGAIIRTADAVGAHGIVIPERRAAGLTGVVSKASAGALAHFPVARVVNISATLDRLKKENIWIVGVEAGSKTSYVQYDFKDPVAIVVGGEGKGIHQKILEKCDQVVSLPMRGHVSSLNVSVAVGVVAYEVLKQRQPALQLKGAK